MNPAGEAGNEGAQTISQVVLSFLRNENVTKVFGIPGGYNLYFMKEFDRFPDIAFIRAQHEEGAAFMADGYARESRKFGCLLTTAGPGATNTITGIISSYADSTPILSIIGAVPVRKTYKGAIQDTYSYGIDTANIFNEITRFHASVFSKENFMHFFRNAVTYLFKGRRGPVVLNIASDLFNATIDRNNQIDYPYLVQDKVFDSGALDQFLAIMSVSRSMVVLAGYGVQLASAEEELDEFANLLRIPVMTTPKGKASFDNESPLYLGVHGLGANVIPEKYLEDESIDIVFIIGTSFNEFATNAWSENLEKGKRIYHLDIDPYTIGRNYPSSIGLVGDAKSSLAYLNLKVREAGKAAFSKLDVSSLIATYRSSYSNICQLEQYGSPGVPLKPQYLMKLIHELFPQNDVSVFIDIGQVIWWAGHFLRLRKGWKYHASLGFSSMGYGIAAAIGGKLASPDRAVIAIVGDGGALMNGNELKTASENNVAVIVFVLNDGNLNIIRHSTQLMFGKSIDGVTYSHRTDFVKFAESLGVGGIRIEDPGQLDEALVQRVIAEKKPFVFDCWIDPEEMAGIEKRIKAVSIQ